MKKRRTTRSPNVAETPPRYPAHSGARLLLDTHVWLWWKAGARSLGPRARETIVRAGEVRLSVASVWEIVIKVSSGKLRIPALDSFAVELAKHGFRELPVELRHVEAVAQLPRIHRDPFDRIICAQAGIEGLTLVTSDARLSRCGIQTLPAAI